MEQVKLEELEEHCKLISDGVKSLKESGITEEALYLLIQHASPTIGGNRIPVSTIKKVLTGVEELNKFVWGGS